MVQWLGLSTFTAGARVQSLACKPQSMAKKCQKTKQKNKQKQQSLVCFKKKSFHMFCLYEKKKKQTNTIKR